MGIDAELIGALDKRGTHLVAEISARRMETDAEDAEVGRQPVFGIEEEQRRQQHAQAEIARAADDHDRVGAERVMMRG